MSALFEAISRHAERRPEAVALHDAASALTYGQLVRRVQAAADELRGGGIKALGLLADNGVEWALCDLAALSAGILLVPLPSFFSPQQLMHAIRDSGVEAILTDQPGRAQTFLHRAIEAVRLASFTGMRLLPLPGVAAASVPAGTAKVTYTSGTTGQPKGVCLGREAMELVAQSLWDVSGGGPDDRHLALLPLSTLLENIGGVYVPLLAGASSCLLPSQQVGLRGASALDPAVMMRALAEQRASSAIMVPQMLHALVAARAAGAPAPPALRFIAVGGAPVSPQLLGQAQRLGLPVYEGYGLSECASVVAVNAPGANLPGSVGKPLPHVRLRFAEDGEILVAGATFNGYLGLADGPDAEGYWPSGDLGYMDDGGYLHLTGRKKNMFITSFGRNVAPEWVERELTIQPAIAQAAVFGEARPWNVAVIVPRPLPGMKAAQAVALAIAAANKSLPDYARVGKWVFADEPFTPDGGLLTANGRLRRAEIKAHYLSRMNALYQEEENR